MKKELIAGILLAAVFVGALINIRICERYFTELTDEIREVYEEASHGNDKKARALIEKALSHWERLGSYTRIFIGHADVDSVNNAIFGFCADVYSGERDRLRGSFGYLISCLEDLRETEGLSLRSIF